MERARQRASGPRTSVHAHPPRSFQIEFAELTWWMEQADRMHDQAEEMLTKLAFARAAWFFDEATQHYERRRWVRTSEATRPARARVVPMSTDTTDDQDEGDDDSVELPGFDLSWPDRFEPGGEGPSLDTASGFEGGAGSESLSDGVWGGGSDLDTGSLLDSVSSTDGSSSGGSSGWWD